MKYIKTYNESVNFQQDISEQDITEICYDITDDGTMRLDFNDGNWYNIIHLKSTHRYKGFLYTEEVEEVVLRLCDYLGNKFCNISFRDIEGTWIKYDKQDLELITNRKTSNNILDTIKIVYLKYT